MKRYSIIFLLAMLVSALTISGCKKNKLIDQEEELYNQFVTPELEKALTELGMTVNRGTKPPKMEGYYMYEPYCIANTTGDNHLGGGWADFYFSLLNQKGFSIDQQAFQADHNSYSSHTGNGIFISGKGDSFTIFVEDKIVEKKDNGRTYFQSSLSVYSGEVVRDRGGNVIEIRNFLQAVLMKDNGGDPQTIDNNTGRLFEASGGYVQTISKTEFDNYIRRYTGIVNSETTFSEGASIFSIVK